MWGRARIKAGQRRSNGTGAEGSTLSSGQAVAGPVHADFSPRFRSVISPVAAPFLERERKFGFFNFRYFVVHS